jgi:hypothetical protein
LEDCIDEIDTEEGISSANDGESESDSEEEEEEPEEPSLKKSTTKVNGTILNFCNKNLMFL